MALYDAGLYLSQNPAKTYYDARSGGKSDRAARSEGRMQERALPTSPLAAGSSDFTGSWRLIDCVTRLADGQIIRPFGDTPGGMILYGSDGRMSVHLLRGGDVADALRDLPGYTGYYGRFTVDAATQIIVHHLEGSSDPQIHGDQVRGFRFEADRLILSGAFAGTLSELIWQRL